MTGWTDCSEGKIEAVAASTVKCESNRSVVLDTFRRECVGKAECAVAAGKESWPDDPCFGVYKSVFVAASCSSGAGRVTAITPTEAPQKAAVTIPAQQSFVLQLPAGSKPAYLWGGDRWQSAPDHFKSHDYMAWVPFAFSADGSAVEPLAYAKTWQLQLAGGA